MTPKLAAKYQEIKAAGHPFEVVLLSADRTLATAQAYHRKAMPWPMLQFGQKPSCILDVKGYPTLVVFDPSGNTCGWLDDGIDIVMTVPFEHWSNYEKFKTEQKKAGLATAGPGPVNRAGARMALGTGSWSGTLYCGRRLGTAVIPGSDGQCGPGNGPQCPDCRAGPSAAAAPPAAAAAAEPVAPEQPE
jgi:hypothetical protein